MLYNLKGIVANFQNKIDNYNSYLIMLFLFFLPLSIALSNLFIGLVFLLWIIKFDFKSDINKLRDNKILQLIMLFLLLHFVGLLWTENIEYGLYVIKKELKLLYIPILMLFIQKEHMKYYISMFLFAMFISEVVSYGIFFEMIEPFKSYTTVYNPSPFMSHLTYTPFLVIASSIVLFYLTFKEYITKTQRLLYLLFFTTISINIFITGGRAGQVMYFVMLVIFIFKYYKVHVKSIILAFLLPGMIFITAYKTSTIFHDRFNLAVSNVKNYKDNPNTSVGIRINLFINHIDIIKDNLLFGVGTGDRLDEYKNIHDNKTPNHTFKESPHNMYILVTSQFGIVGLALFLYIFYSMIMYAHRSKDKFVNVIGTTIPILFLVLMMSGIYLFVHHTTLLFVFFVALLFQKDLNEEKHEF